jgi:hypothetical protein
MTDRDPRGPSTPPGAPDAPGASGAPAAPERRRAKAPDHRPTWLVLLSALTLLYGGSLLVSSLDGLGHPHAPARPPTPRALTPAEEVIARQIADVDARVAADHARALRGKALVSLPVGLVMLFAAAATLSRDRRGRALALGAAWLGIAYQLGTAALTYPVLRDFARAGAPLYAQFLALGTDAAGATPELISKMLMASFTFTVVVAISGSLIMIRYFGGRRGRVLYGLERARPGDRARASGRPSSGGG